MNIKTTLKTSVAAAALFAIAAPAATPASAAETAVQSKPTSTLVISGQVVRALWYGDDGEHSGLFNTSGESAHSRVRWIATGTLNENVTAGGVIEMDIPLSNDSNSGSNFGTGALGDGANADNPNWSIRHQYVWAAHKKFGKVYLGQTDAAANGNMQANLSSAFAGLSTQTNVWVGQTIRFLDTSTNPRGSNTGVTPGTVMSDMDFTSRQDVIRYDTPSFMGLTLSVSYADDSIPEIGARYKGKFGPVAVEARAGWNNQNGSSTTVSHDYGGSLAVLHDSGLNAALSIGRETMQASTRANKKNWFGLLGYNAKIFKVGGTGFAATYARTDDNIQNGDEGTAWGLQASQDFDAIGAKLSLVYRNYDYENGRPSVGHQTISSIDVFGMQAVFNF